MKPFCVRLILLAAIAAFAPFSAQAQWSADQKLSTTDTNAMLNENMGRCLAVSGDSVYVVWVDTKTGSVYHKHSYDGGSTWSADMIVATGHCAFPSIAASGGSVHIAYRGAIGTDYYSYYVRSLDGGNTWGAALSLGKFYWWPSITCEGNHVFVAINDTLANTAYNSEVYFFRSMDNGSTWDSLVRISNAAGRSEDPSIAAAGGCVHMAWNDNRTGIMQTWYRRSTDAGATWLPDTQLTNSTVFCYFPILCASGSNVDLAYGDRQTGNYEIHFKQSTDFGETWAGSIQLTHAGGTSTEAYPVIARSGDDIHVVWFLFGGGVYYEHSGDGARSWDSEVTLSSKASNPFVATGNGATHVIWIDHREGYAAVYYKHRLVVSKQATLAVPTNLAFEKSRVGGEVDLSIEISNPTNTAIAILKDTIDSPVFKWVSAAPPMIIPANDSIRITMGFSPTSSQSYSGAVWIITNESSINLHRIMLSGEGVSQSVVTAGSSIDQIQIFPNPANTNATLRLTNQTSLENVSLSYYDVAGKLLGTETIGNVSAGHVNLPMLLPQSTGALFVRVTSDGRLLDELKIVQSR
ncbi:MAG: T9SS type A sorting domain-containing protein [Bacteroidota bacterium]|nr:T9SS type A sorting domain-containing protein [Bacteroidota bacterium]MDP4233385.1 T9SS type A sorting domain-containing protein [Bacteroidota bacterium]MDP4242251.1 T9SS type A sorting domain-containing protein [Bacteroidota bacterium]MDP4287007.1 T9SS type A sorting domain-containing protein [Bacteroidota bacterium]